jgi:hypothetical protein
LWLRALGRIPPKKLIINHVCVRLHDTRRGIDGIKRLQIRIRHHAQDAIRRDGLCVSGVCQEYSGHQQGSARKASGHIGGSGIALGFMTSL